MQQYRTALSLHCYKNIPRTIRKKEEGSISPVHYSILEWTVTMDGWVVISGPRRSYTIATVFIGNPPLQQPQEMMLFGPVWLIFCQAWVISLFSVSSPLLLGYNHESHPDLESSFPGLRLPLKAFQWLTPVSLLPTQHPFSILKAMLQFYFQSNSSALTLGLEAI